MAKITHFTAGMFTATEHTPAKEKAEWANRLASFIVNGFKPGDFTNIIYTRLSQCFGHIAHFNRDGFYSVWFSAPEQQAKFVKHMLEHKSFGSPKHTFSDVEKEFQTWLAGQNIEAKVEQKAVNERAYIALEDTADHALALVQSSRNPHAVEAVMERAVGFVQQFVADPLDSDRVKAVRDKMLRKYTQNAIEFRLADISHDANSFGHHGHIFMARDGEVWQVTKYRLPSDPVVGETIFVKMKDGVLNWMSLGYEIPERLKKATDDQLAKVWGAK